MKNIFILYITIALLEVSFGQIKELRLYTPSNKLSYALTTATNIASTSFSNARKTYFVIHGYQGAASDAWMIKIKDNLLSKESVNVFLVDWSTGASSANYFTSAANAKTTGTALGTFMTKTSINPNTIHCIGHSLGAHVCGFAGKTQKFARITGLDPAGPSFKGTASTQRLAIGDATSIDCIHTDGIFGIQDAICNKNFFPNGGTFQPGCPLVGKRESSHEKGDIGDFLSCSHTRAPLYYAESITSTCKFTSKPCNTYSDFQNNRCSCSASCPTMGHSGTTLTGRFYLNTNGASPFCKS